MNRNFKLVLTFGALALVAIFVLVSFAKTSFYNSLDESIEDYDTQDLLARDSGGFVTGDPLVAPGNIQPEVFPSDPLRGHDNAELTIIEFGDFQCPYCSQIAVDLQTVLLQFPTVSLAWKDLANPVHFQARNAALAARCGQDQGKFWEYHDKLFENQRSLGQNLYIEIAQNLDLDISRFKQCYNAQAFTSVVGAGLDQANFYGVDGTPYLFIGETRIDRAVPYAELSRTVTRELKKIRN